MDFSLQFLNTSAGLTSARYNTDGSKQFFLTTMPEEIYENPHTNLDTIIRPLLDEGTDILSFSEVFGKTQRDYLKGELEQRGYEVYITSAFEMWSQSVDEEHLYNVVGVKLALQQSLRDVHHHEFRNKRPIEGIGIGLRYLLAGSGEGEKGKISQALHLRKRLAMGILDGAISLLDFDDFTLATGHVHKFNGKAHAVLGQKIQEGNKPFILLGDMNVSHGKDILLRPPFNTPDFQSLIHPEKRTFGFVDGLTFRDRRTLFAAHMQPDVLITRGVNPIDIRLIQSLSDHNGIEATLQIG